MTQSDRHLPAGDVPSQADAAREKQRGCIAKQCDEDGGFTCRSTWRCAPDEAMPDEASGCVPIPCSESGHCSSDDIFICEPPGDAKRPPGMDVNGCVVRNCEEGYTCQYTTDGTNHAYCDVSSPEADGYGCVIRSCEEDPGCPTSYVCDPGAEFVD